MGGWIFREGQESSIRNGQEKEVLSSVYEADVACAESQLYSCQERTWVPAPSAQGLGGLLQS